MLTFLLASMSIVTIFLTYKNLLDLKISIGNICTVYCYQTIKIPFHIENIQYDRFSLNILYKNESQTVDLPKDSQETIIFNFKTDSRGQHKLNKFTFSTTFPLGLFRAWSYFEVDEHYIVYPKPQGIDQLPEQSLYKSALLGDQGKGSDDFSGQRKYVPGDSLKQVNWKALAKQQGLLTKQFGGDRCEEIWLDWSITEGLLLESRLSQLALWLIQAEHMGLSYGLKLPNMEINPSHGENHFSKCMHALALF